MRLNILSALHFFVHLSHTVQSKKKIMITKKGKTVKSRQTLGIRENCDPRKRPGEKNGSVL